MKKTIALRAATLAACIALTCTACGGGSSQPSSQPTVDLSPATSAGSEGGQATPQEKPAQPAPQASQGCSLAEQANNDIPKTAPPVDQWVDVKGISVPTSATYGPEKREGDLFTCYQHSPTGALFATFYAAAGPGRVPGADKAWYSPTLLSYSSQVQKTDKSKASTNNTSTRIAGYRFESYTPEKSIISLAFAVQTENGEQTVSMKMPLIWSGDRWLLTDEGLEPPLPLNNLQSFTIWGANA